MKKKEIVASKIKLAELINEKVRGRKIVLRGSDVELEKILEEKYSLKPAFYVTYARNKENGNDIFHISKLKEKMKEIFLVIPSFPYKKKDVDVLQRYGYRELEDFVYFKHKPIIVELNKNQNYEDAYYNIVSGGGGQGKVILYGWNNKVIIEKNTKFADMLIEVKNSSEIEIGEGTIFSGKNSVFLADESKITIGKMCKFFSVKLVAGIGARVSILNKCTFGENDLIRTGYMGNIEIGEDCMFSWDVMVLGNDGHAIFDVLSGERSNLENELVTEIGNHVWIGARCNILPKAKIADGSIIGTASVVTKSIDNNCAAAGNPAKIIKKNVAWHRNPMIRDIDLCPSQYVNLTDC